MIKERIKWREDKSLRKIWITCDRDGKIRLNIFSINSRRPNSKSKKIIYFIYAIFVKEGKNSGIQKFFVIKSKYNHEFLRFSAFSAIRKIYKNEEFKKKIALDKASGIKIKQFYNTDILANVKNLLIIRDYYNERVNARREKLGSRSPIHALLNYLLNAYDIEFDAYYRIELGAAGNLMIYLYFSHK
jgi:hypothetical protein